MPNAAIDRHDGTSSEEESDGEVVITTRRKSFGIRVAQTPQQAQQQVLSQIGNLAGERQVNEVVVQQTQSHEKTEAEKKALEQHQKMIEAQQLAKAQQAAALQAAAARIAQAQSQAQTNQSAQSSNNQAHEQAKTAQQEALARAQEAQKKAQAEALKKAQEVQAQAQEAQKKAHAEALKRAQEAQAQAQEAQKKAQAEAQRRAQEAQAQAQEAQKKAQVEALKKAQEAQKKAQAEALKKSQEIQAQAQEDQKKAQTEALKKGQEAQAQQKAQMAQRNVQLQNAQTLNPSVNKTNTTTTTSNLQQQQNPGKPSRALSQAQPVPQEMHAATGPKWSRTPGKVHTQGPQPEQPKQVTAVAPPSGNTALKQTVQTQEQELAVGGHLPALPVMAQKPQIQANELSQKFIEKEEQQREKLVVQKGQQLEGAKRWAIDSESRELPANNMQQVERGPKAVILADDACWQTQRRVPIEIQQPQVGKIAIPELSEKEVQRTIVAQPASYHKVQWNEFPEEPQYEITAAPKTKTQEWVPVNNELNELQRSIYKPARMSAVWPPPQDELVKEEHSPLIIKANDDTAWIQQDANGVQKQAVWGKTARINRVWPPPEHESTLSDFGPQHMPVVQWPPPEAEAHEREQVEVLQKHIPTKKMERQWPPPPPQYQVVESTGEIETRYNPAEISDSQQAVNSLRMGHISS